MSCPVVTDRILGWIGGGRHFVSCIEIHPAKVDVLLPEAVDPGVGVQFVERCHTSQVVSGRDKGLGGE